MVKISETAGFARLVALSRQHLLNADSSQHTPAREDQSGVMDSAVDAASNASSDQEQGTEAVHGLCSLNFGGEKFGKMLPSQSGENTISDAIGQHIGPLSHSRGGDSDSLGSGCDRAPKQFDGASFKHDGLEVSTLTVVPQVCLP